MAKTNVTLLLKGLLVLSAAEGEEVGKVGVVDPFPPGHDLTISVTKTPPHGNPILLSRADIEDRLWLEIEGGSPDKIAILDKTTVNRKKPPTNPKSFRWFVNMENDELYDKTVEVDATAFSSILTFNGGRLSTARKPNENILHIARGLFANYEPLGRVALEIGIDFDSATRAVFKNGSTPVFDSATESVNKYVISMTHDDTTHLPIVTDGNFYYSAADPDVDDDDRILFLSSSLIKVLEQRWDKARTDGKQQLARSIKDAIDELLKNGEEPPAGPEAACFPLYFGRSAF